VTEYIEYKKSVVRYTKWLSEHGYFGSVMGSGGNVSIRVAGEEAIAITPSGIPYLELIHDDICILGFDQNLIEGRHAPSMESLMHINVYKERPDVHAIVHTHQDKASLFSVINRPIPALFDEVCMNIGEIVDVVPYAISGSAKLADNVAGKVKNGCNCYVLQNHGALSLGATIEKACLNAELLEKIATIYADALFTGEKISTLPEETVEVFKQMRMVSREKNERDG